MNVLPYAMAAVTVSVLEDATLRISEAVASAYLSRVREGSALKSTRAGQAAAGSAAPAAAATPRAARDVAARRTAVMAASAASKVVRYALQLQPRLKTTRSLEKFRNEVGTVTPGAGCRCAATPCPSSVTHVAPYDVASIRDRKRVQDVGFKK